MPKSENKNNIIIKRTIITVCSAIITFAVIIVMGASMMLSGNIQLTAAKAIMIASLTMGAVAGVVCWRVTGGHRTKRRKK